LYNAYNDCKQEALNYEKGYEALEKFKDDLKDKLYQAQIGLLAWTNF